VASAIPGAVNGLLTLLTAALDCDVHDGPPVTAATPDYVCVGFDPTGDEAVEFDREWASLGAQRREERFDVLCVAGTSSGDLSMLDRRTRVFGLLAAVETAVAADLTLGGAVRDAQVLGSGSLLQEQDEQGATAMVRFRVTCTSRI
jgi:hypothetical protein